MVALTRRRPVNVVNSVGNGAADKPKKKRAKKKSAHGEAAKAAADPSKAAVDPSKAAADPSKAAADPSKAAADPSKAAADPSASPPAAATALPPAQQPLLATSVQPREALRGGGVRVGHITVTDTVLGFGSGGTVVYEGEFNGRPVAVKRLLRHLFDLAHKELGALILSDEHPNIVRCFCVEEDHEFLYMALERCRGSLAAMSTDEAFAAQFVDAEGAHTPYAMQVAQELCEGLQALHSRGIVHRDLKPHNVLLTESGRAKLSDMGLSKRLGLGESSFETMGTPGGSSGWQAPEQLADRSGGAVKQSKAMDVFSLGILLFYVLTGGSHPFGATFERDYNILGGRPNLSALSDWPEAVNLIGAMISSDPKRRPPIQAVRAHPVWWSPQQALLFVIQVSDRTEYKDWEEDKRLPQALEACAPAALCARGTLEARPSWARELDPQLLENLGRYRRYSACSLRDLLRVIRNKHNHYRELPAAVQSMLGTVPDGYWRYFLSRFPQLLMAVYSFAASNCHLEPTLERALPPDLVAFPFHERFMAGQPKELPPQAEEAGVVGGLQAAAPSPALQQWAAAAEQGEGRGALWVRQMGAVLPPVFADNPTMQPIAASKLLQMAGEALNAQAYLASTSAQACLPPLVAGKHPVLGTFVLPIFPQRSGASTCDFYMRTGHCKYGQLCHFHHPEHCMVPLSMQRLLPLRPGQVACSYYTRNGVCKFGPMCRNHHPPEVGPGVVDDPRMVDDPWMGQ